MFSAVDIGNIVLLALYWVVKLKHNLDISVPPCFILYNVFDDGSCLIYCNRSNSSYKTKQGVVRYEDISAILECFKCGHKSCI